MKYYVDTCIWIDYWENRKGLNNEPLGDYAARFFLKAMNDRIIISNFVISELRDYMNDEDIDSMLKIFMASDILNIINVKSDDIIKAKQISIQRDTPANDVVHALIASRNNAILITQDRHFLKLKDIVESKRPQDL